MCDCRLQIVLVSTRDSNQVPLNLRLDFQFQIAQEFRNLLGCLGRKTHSDRDIHLRRAAGRLPNFSERQVLKRDVAADEFLLDDFKQCPQPALVLGRQRQLFLVTDNIGLNAFEIKPRLNLAPRLIQGVVDLLQIDGRNHVERKILGHMAAYLTLSRWAVQPCWPADRPVARPNVESYRRAVNPFLSVRGLCKSYAGVPAVIDLSFDVGPGETFGLLGPNGAGKSTTIGCLYGIVRPDRGRMDVMGIDVAGHLRKIKSMAGIVPQDECLDPDLTVEENLWVYGMYFGLEAPLVHRRTDEILQFIELQEHRKKKVPELSGGMRRRLIIARALVNEPNVLILDEPTTGLDPQARHLVWSRLRELKRRGVSMLLTTHYMEEAQMLCDRMAVIDQGRKVVEATPAELIERYVGQHVIEIRMPALPAEIKSSFHADVECQQFEDTVYVLPRHHVTEILRRLSETNLPFTSRPANLEDVFLKIVGRGLRD